MEGELEIETNTAEPAEEQGSSIRDLLTAEFDKAETARVLEESAPEETAEQTAQRVRDERGRFAKGEQAPKPETPEGAQPETNLEPEAAEAQQQTAQQAPSIANLPHLTSDERAVLSKIDPAAQQVVARRLDEQHRKLSEYGRKIAAYRELDDNLAPRKQQLALNGISEGTYLKQLMTAADMLDENPVESIKYFLRRYNVDPSQLTETQQSAATSEESPLAREVAQLRNYVQTQEQQRLQAEQQKLVTTIESFKNAADAQGKPLRPHLLAVQAEFVPLIQSVRNANPELNHEQAMQKAYEMACYANPVVRQQISQSQTAEQLAQQRKVAEDARKRGSSVVGTSGAGITPAKDESIRGLLTAAINGQLN